MHFRAHRKVSLVYSNILDGGRNGRISSSSWHVIQSLSMPEVNSNATTFFTLLCAIIKKVLTLLQQIRKFKVQPIREAELWLTTFH